MVSALVKILMGDSYCFGKCVLICGVPKANPLIRTYIQGNIQI